MPETFVTREDAEYARTYGVELATVSAWLPDLGDFRRIEVFGPRVRFGAMRESTVNWPALGSVSAADAKAFADALLEAARVAASLYPVAGS